MSLTLLFPGQGSQSVGMGRELYDNYPTARATFDAVDDALGQKLSDIIFNGPMDELTLTTNVQPAIFGVSMAMMAAKIERDGPINFDFVAGHSLGEYSALCATGAISLADGARLLRLRGDAMQRAVPTGRGAMAVIMGLDIDRIREICATAEQVGDPTDHFNIADVANDNAPGQVVISGGSDTINRAMELARNAGAKRAMLLPLSVPPHSRLMAPVADEMRAALNNIEMRAPAVPLISNKTCAPMTNPDEIRDALVYQITHGVRWRETILALPGLGVTDVMEIGPGTVLTGLTGRIVPELNIQKLDI